MLACQDSVKQAKNYVCMIHLPGGCEICSQNLLTLWNMDGF